MSAVKEHLEIEIKVKLESFADYLKLVGYMGSPDSVDQQINCFFDSEDGVLKQNGWALRVRAEPNRGYITLKGAARTEGETGGAIIREEIEGEISREEALFVIDLKLDVLSLDVPPTAYLKQHWPDIRLAKLVQFRNERQRKRHRFGDYHYDLLLDKTEFADASCDYELELEITRPEQSDVVIPALQKLFHSLDIPFEHQSETKLARALERSARF